MVFEHFLLLLLLLLLLTLLLLSSLSSSLLLLLLLLLLLFRSYQHCVVFNLGTHPTLQQRYSAMEHLPENIILQQNTKTSNKSVVKYSSCID